MATESYLAMRSEEFVSLGHSTSKLAWLDCCFSQSGPGLDQLPSTLPPNSLLILTDQIPFHCHDTILISEQLCQAVISMRCAGVLLDFEKPKQEELAILAVQLVSTLPCPVAVSELYAKDIDCPVFLSPCPHHVHLKDHIAAWTGREIWLDLARDAEMITVAPSGSVISSTPWIDDSSFEHSDQSLHCHYRIQIEAEKVHFILRRTKDDLIGLKQEAEKLRIHTCVGLYQEWQ